jgi:hypothetical protein
MPHPRPRPVHTNAPAYPRLPLTAIAAVKCPHPLPTCTAPIPVPLPSSVLATIDGAQPAPALTPASTSPSVPSLPTRLSAGLQSPLLLPPTPSLRICARTGRACGCRRHRRSRDGRAGRGDRQGQLCWQGAPRGSLHKLAGVTRDSLGQVHGDVGRVLPLCCILQVRALTETATAHRIPQILAPPSPEAGHPGRYCCYDDSLRPIHLVLHRHTDLDGYTVLPGVPNPGRRQEGQQLEVPLLGKPR